MDALPVTRNGKRNLAALPKPDFRGVQVGFVAPRDEVERSLCNCWQDMLNVERIGVHDDFWALGGRSVQALLVCNFVRQEFGVEINMSGMFGRPSVSQLAERISLELDLKRVGPTRLKSEVAEEDVEEGKF